MTTSNPLLRHISRALRPLLPLLLLAAVACGSADSPVPTPLPTPQVVAVEKVIEKEVVREVPRDVVVEREVIRDIIIEQVVIEQPALTREASTTTPELPQAAGATIPTAAEAAIEPVGLIEPVTIGTIFAYTGALSNSSVVMRNGVDLAIYLLNEAGGILGRPVRALHKDSGSDPEIAVKSARSLVEQNRLGVILGPLSSSATLAVARQVTVPNSVLQISPSSTSPELTTLADDDFLFRTTAQDSDQGRVLAQLAREEYDTAGVLYVDNHYGLGLSGIFKEQFEQDGGQVLAMVPVTEKESSYMDALVAVTADNPEVIMAITYNASAEVYLKEALDGGFADTFMFVDGTKNQEMFDRINDARLDGSIGISPGANSPARAVFHYLYQQRFGQVPSTVFIAESFDALVLLALAIEAAGSEDGPAVRDALRQVANPPGEIVGPGDLPRALELLRAGQEINYEGAAGNQDFDENGDVFGTFEIWMVADGQVTSTRRFITP